MSALTVIWFLFRGLVANRATLAVENLALRQQLAVLRRSIRRPRLRRRDWLFWTFPAAAAAAGATRCGSAPRQR